jgi:nitric oxide reductase NorQ protein
MIIKRAFQPFLRNEIQDGVFENMSNAGQTENATANEQHGSQIAPYYLPVGDEVEIFLSAYEQRLPVLLKGPTGCGKTRFVEYMTWRLYQGDLATDGREEVDTPLQTVACHEDLSATDLVGRFLLQGEETVWQDGPLSRSVKEGAICYLDEIVEARKDSTVLIHSLTDHRRILPVEKQGLILEAHKNFLLVISYNPGYQNVLKDLKPSTRQRFIAIDFDYPDEAKETEVIQHESGVDKAVAKSLATLGAKVRNLKHHGFDEGVSTRLLVYAAQLIVSGVSHVRACDVAISRAVSDDPEVSKAISELVSTLFVSE